MPPPLEADAVISQTAFPEHLSKLQQEKEDLQVMLDMAIEHSDMLLDMLRQENQELTLLLKKEVTGPADVNLSQQSSQSETVSSGQPVAQTFPNKALPIQSLPAETLPVGLLIARMIDGQILYGNAAMCQFLGVSAEQLRGRLLTDFCCGSTEQQQLTTVMVNQQLFNGELHWRLSDGRAAKTIVLVQPFVFGDEPAVLTVVQTATVS